jgi:ABC-2 type transport system ATP-binding protein
MENVLEIANLTKNYGDFILDEVSFALPQGYIMGLVGPNGAGKTTIIKLIMNLIMKNRGTIRIFGLDHQRQEVEIKSRIGFVYDLPNFYDHLSLRQMKNIIRRFYKTWDEPVFQNLAERFELPQRKAMRKFSRGMQMKAAIAIALSHHADFILMDEPTSGLDPVFRRELLELLYDLLQNEKKSILFSTHITSDLERIADYITFINHGRLVFSSTKDEVFEKYALVKGGREMIDEETRPWFIGIHMGEFGFEALTDDVSLIRKRFGASVVIDRPTLEDIMYYSNLRGNHA